MSLTVGLGSERKITDVALEWSLAIVSPHVPDQGALVCTGIAAHVALVRRQPQVHAGMTCQGKQRGKKMRRCDGKDFVAYLLILLRKLGFNGQNFLSWC